MMERVHHKRLKKLFTKYYQPYDNGETNKCWTTLLKTSVMEDLRLHCGWIFGITSFYLTDQELGIDILKYMDRSGILKVVTHDRIEKNHEHIMRKYGEVELEL